MGKEAAEKWYDTYYSVIFIPPGQNPQTKGAWPDSEYLVQMLTELPKHCPPDTVLMVAESRCGELCVHYAAEWLEMRAVGIECAAEEEAYIRAGICADCGACNKLEAEGKCKPRPLGDTGDYTCAGEYLWQEEEGDA